MPFLIAFVVFIAAILTCLITGKSMAFAMVIGYSAFFLAALRRVSARQIFQVSLLGIKDALLVVRILMLIGILTATWRMSGVIAFFVYYGVKAISPPLFLVITFILSSIISYALGTSVGVAGTSGVILMAIAKSGGYNEVMAAGAILSGIFFGDRTSPTASAANVIAYLTHTNLYQNVTRMWKSAALPLLICLIIYGALSFANPLAQLDNEMPVKLQQDFTISWWLLLPFLLMLLLPLLKVNVAYAMTASALTASVLAFTLKGYDVLYILRAWIYGYHPGQAALGNIWDGGGLLSMVNIIIIVAISSTFSGIFRISGVLVELNKWIEASISKLGLSLTLLLTSMLSAGVMVSQVSASIMTHTLFKQPYEKRGIPSSELAHDLSSSIILIADIIPWCLSSAVPVSLLGTTSQAILWSFFIFLLPLLLFVPRILKKQ